jgi:hypothetical protein
VYLPSSYDGSKRFPLWVHLHGVFWNTMDNISQKVSTQQQQQQQQQQQPQQLLQSGSATADRDSVTAACPLSLQLALDTLRSAAHTPTFCR